MNAEQFNNRGLARQNAGDLDGAAQDFSEAIRLNSGAAAPYFNRALIRCAQNDSAGALQDYDRAICIDPQEPDALTNRGVLLFEMGELEEAVNDFSQLVHILPLCSDGYLKRGIVRYNMGDLHGALEDLNSATSLDPTEPSAYYYRGLTLRDGGHLSTAIREFLHAERLAPSAATSQDEIPFHIGQCWQYKTRKGDEASRLIIYGLTRYPGEDMVVSVMLTGLSLTTQAPSGTAVIEALPLLESALRRSVTQLENAVPKIPADLDSSAFLFWFREFQERRAGAWTLSVAEIVEVFAELPNCV